MLSKGKLWWLHLLILLGVMMGTKLWAVKASDLFLIDDEELIISNYPEEFKEPGVVFCKALNQKALRVVYYHKNGCLTPYYISLRIKNNETRTADIKLIIAQAGPTKDGIFSGQMVTKGFFLNVMNKKWQDIKLAPGANKQVVWHLLKPQTISTGIVRLAKNNDVDVDVKLEIVEKDNLAISSLNDNDMNTKFSFGCFQTSYEKICLEYDGAEVLKNVLIGAEP